jgi:tetratricopeptide (TPR) repeat protein/tRNA A-37 threonylcarbamoyl transferase component Bud32
MKGQTISHYHILEKLGEGGMGVVYVAEDTHLTRRVALKFLNETADSHHYRARFLREARAISALSHPHIATIYDYGETEDGHPFIVMELVTGETLGDLLYESGLTLVRSLEIIEQVAEALSEAHSHGIIHRDIKPSNVLINARGQVKVLDFGLAKQLNEETDDTSTIDPDANTVLASRTHSNVVVGTPLYLSPEQAKSAPVDARSDLFALGALLYECITGRPAFSGASVLEIAGQVIHVMPSVPSQINERVPKALDRVTMKALQKEPAERYQTAEEMLDDLRRVRLSISDDTHVTKRLAKRSGMKTSQTSALVALSETLREPRLSIFTVLLGVLAVVLVGWLAVKLLRPGPHEPTDEAKRWYKTGTDALRDGAYYQASRALEHAIAEDNNFPLAHARLAEALTELDYSDKAKDELLRVWPLIPNRSVLPRSELLYLEAINATVSNDPQAVEYYRQIAQLMPDNPEVYVDLGRAYEKNHEREKAIENYVEAINRDSPYATAYLRVGILYGEKQDIQSALAAFDKAEGLYQALGNIEGLTEVRYQRGLLYDKTGKTAEAQAQLQQALETARVSNNEHQQIRAILQLSSVAYTAGNTALSQELARKAVELAQAKGMENLTARGLVDLGYAYLAHGDYSEAETYFQQALDFAKRYKGRRNEARALFSLASLRIQQGNADEALRYILPALKFYQEGGYRQETSTALLLLGRANRLKGDYEEALKAFEQQLNLGEQWGALAQVASSHSEIGRVLIRQARYTEALPHFEASYLTNKSLGDQLKLAYNFLDQGNLAWQMGRYPDARSLLKHSFEMASNPSGGSKALLADVTERNAEMALSERHLPEARTKGRDALNLAGTQYQDTAIQAKVVLCLAQLFSGAARAGKSSCEEAAAMAAQSGDPWLSSKATLALAEAILESGDIQNALTAALRAQDSTARLGDEEAEWRAWLVAALASRRTGDQPKAHEYSSHAAELLSRLEQKWGAEVYNSYLARPDIQYARKRLGEIR